MESIKKQVADLFSLRFPTYGVVYSIADIPSAVKKDGSPPKIAGVPELSEANEYLLKLYDLATHRPEEFGQFVSMIQEKTEAQAQAEMGRAERARPFNQPQALADAAVFDHWAQRRWWGLDEALLLLLGRNPMHVDLAYLSQVGIASAFVRKFAELRAVALTHVGGIDAQLSNPVPPGIFLKWAERYKKEIPAELLSAVREYGHNVQDWQGAYKQKEAELERASNQVKALFDALKAQSQKIKELEEQAKAPNFTLGPVKAQEAPLVSTSFSSTSVEFDSRPWWQIRHDLDDMVRSISEKWLTEHKEQRLFDNRINQSGPAKGKINKTRLTEEIVDRINVIEAAAGRADVVGSETIRGYLKGLIIKLGSDGRVVITKSP